MRRENAKYAKEAKNAKERIEIREGRYTVRFARTRSEIDDALRLRFEIFNLELREGLPSSFHTGRDRDEFDETCHHLIVMDTGTGKIVGTYRMQTGEMAAAGHGFYTVREFDLARFPSEILKEGIELGRACVAQSHRNTQALFLLWKGLAAYASHNCKRYLFGCCSLTSQDTLEGQGVMDLLKKQGHLHPTLYAPTNREFTLESGETDGSVPGKVKIPTLFRTYLRFGAKVCSSPAIDREFKTIDFLVIFDMSQMTGQMMRMFYQR